VGAAKSDEVLTARVSPDQVLSYRQLWGATWKLLVVSMLLDMHSEIDDKIMTPYYYTRVHCCGPDSYSIPNEMEFLGEADAEDDPIGASLNRPLKMSIDNSTCCDICAATRALCSTGQATSQSFAWDGQTFSATCPDARPQLCSIEDVYGGAAVSDQRIDACDVPELPRDHVLWAHSRHCSNWAYVREEAQKWTVSFQALSMVVGMIFLPSLGNVADLYGRKQVFFWSSAVMTIAFLTFTCDAAFELSDFCLYFTAIIFAMSVVHGPAAWAMQMDLVPPASREKWFPIVSGISAAAPLVADVIAYPVLRMHVADYTFVWFALTMVSVVTVLFIYCMIEESMASPKLWTGWREFSLDVLPCRGGVNGRYLDGCGLWCYRSKGTRSDNQRVRILRSIVVMAGFGVFFEGVLTLKNSILLGPMHFKQEEGLIYISWAAKVATIAAAPLSAFVTPRIGAKWAIMLGGVLKVLGYLAFPSFGQNGPYAQAVLTCMGGAFSDPAQMIYIASALGEKNQARGISALFIMLFIPGIFGGPIFTGVFYDPNTFNTPAWMSAGLGTALTFAFVFFYLPNDPDAHRKLAEQAGEVPVGGIELVADSGEEARELSATTRAFTS
jgi:hypothetical protein